MKPTSLFFVGQERRDPIQMPIAGPGMPRYDGHGLGLAFWCIPVAVVALTVLAILLGALWR